MSYIIARKLESGGSVRVALNTEGYPYYTPLPQDGVLFTRRKDAEHYKNYCQANLPTEPGQTDFEVVEI